MKEATNVEAGHERANGVTPGVRQHRRLNGNTVRAALRAPATPASPALPDELALLPIGGRWTSFLDAPMSFRVRDIIVSLVCLIVTAPLMGFIALLIRLDSPGGALFRQRRVSQQRRRRTDAGDRNGHGVSTFEFVKFRTMYVDARERFPELYRYQYTPEEIETLVFKIADDPRLTRIGRWLRRTSLDELPNFINVLKGDMSLVGPRPDIPEMMPYYARWQRLKFTVKPGITGYAQTNGRALLPFQKTLYEDVRYVVERSFLNDLWIMARTAWVSAKRIGAF
jgi:lipopolysaccharide/colanic/teichoic acid biosynthesis glycosyltransferase